MFRLNILITVITFCFLKTILFETDLVKGAIPQITSETADSLSEIDSLVTDSSSTVILNPHEIDDEEGVWFVEKNATFMEGDLNTFSNWLSTQIIYPAEASERKIEGKVFAQFSINRFGQICEIKIVRSINPLLDNEVKRALALSPDWKPATMQGKPVKQLFVIPVDFSLKYRLFKR